MPNAYWHAMSGIGRHNGWVSSEKPQSLLREIGVYLGLLHAPGGEPLRAPKGARSRYGLGTSARLKEDIDDIRVRLARLKDRE